MERNFVYKIIKAFILLLILPPFCWGQLKWVNIDSLYAPLPSSVHVYRTTDSLDGKPNIAYYVEADLKNIQLVFTVDTTYKRRLTPSQYFEKNNKPLLVVNTNFFSFATHQNLNMVVKDGKLISYNIHTIMGKGQDTLTYRHPLSSAIGISKKRNADVAWTFTDSNRSRPYYRPLPVMAIKDSVATFDFRSVQKQLKILVDAEKGAPIDFRKWKVRTAVGGGPVLLQYGEIKITNNEELKFAGKAIHDKHPRTAMGYTRDHKLIVLVVEGRNTGKAEGATLTQLAQVFKDLGCWEALNLDGGGSSCMLVNGRETIRVSDASGQRPVPAVFIIRSK